MGVQVVSVGQSIGTDASFRAWGSAIASAIVAAGLVKTSDTGQINWSTVLKPSGAANFPGFEIYRFNDSLQSTYPVFIKVQYGSSTASNPGMRIGTGTITDGAGTLSGFTTAARDIFNTGASVAAWGSTTPANFWVNSDGSALMMGGYFNIVNLTSGGLFITERMRNWNGTPNGEGLYTIWQNGQSTSGSPINPSRQNNLFANSGGYTQPTPTAVAYNLVPMARSSVSDGVTPSNTAIVGTKAYTYPVFTGWTPQMQGPSKYVIGAFQTDFPVNTQISVNVYGATAQFNMLGSVATEHSTLSGASMSCGFRISS